jgi:hypothetical protein
LLNKRARQSESKLSLHSLALFFQKKQAALGNLKASFHCTRWHCFSNKTGGARQSESKLSLHSLALFFMQKNGILRKNSPVTCLQKCSVFTANNQIRFLE